MNVSILFGWVGERLGAEVLNGIIVREKGPGDFLFCVFYGRL